MPETQTEGPRRRQPQSGHIRNLFTRIATHYDLINRLLSLGLDLRWRRQALKLAHVPQGGRVLDVATGTGDMALIAAAQMPGVHVIGVDLTSAMLDVAQRKAEGHAVAWAQGDGLALPFPDATFDAVLSVFMMRNVPDVGQALREQRRVVRPGGRVICLEMSWPRRLPMSWLFRPYFFGLAPLLGQLIARDREAYTYLPRSVAEFLQPTEMAAQMRETGLQDVRWQARMGGTVIVYVGHAAAPATEDCDQGGRSE